MSSNTKDCQSNFIKLISSEDWELADCFDDDPLFFQIPNWVRNRVNDVGRMLNFQSLNDYTKQFSEMDCLRDFSTKMVMGDVTGVQDYYEKAQRVSCDLSSRAAKYQRPLLNIEALEKAKK